MKRIALGFLLLAGLSLPLSAQDEERTMSLSVSPIGAILGGADLLYQVKVTDFLAITIPANFYYHWLVATAIKMVAKDNKDFSSTKAPISYAGGVGAKFLLANEGISDSFYVEPRVVFGYEQFGMKYSSANAIQKLESSSYRLTPLLRIGWDWVTDSGVFITLGAGAGVNFVFNNKTEIPDAIEDNFAVKYLLPLPSETKKVGFAWDTEFKIGYAW